MEVGKSVRYAITAWELDGDFELAMLHACNAVDGTAGKIYPEKGNKARFTDLLRVNYDILGPMGMPGVNIVDTRFPAKVKRSTTPDKRPDLADIIYGVHRCAHGHGDELPEGFSLIPHPVGTDYTNFVMAQGRVHLSDRIIFGLLAVAVLSPVNIGQTVPDELYLSYAIERFPISDWWGRADDFRTFLVCQPKPPSVLLDFGDWMDPV